MRHSCWWPDGSSTNNGSSAKVAPNEALHGLLKRQMVWARQWDLVRAGVHEYLKWLWEVVNLTM